MAPLQARNALMCTFCKDKYKSIRFSGLCSYKFIYASLFEAIKVPGGKDRTQRLKSSIGFLYGNTFTFSKANSAILNRIDMESTVMFKTKGKQQRVTQYLADCQHFKHL